MFTGLEIGGFVNFAETPFAYQGIEVDEVVADLFCVGGVVRSGEGQGFGEGECFHLK